MYLFLLHGEGHCLEEIYLPASLSQAREKEMELEYTANISTGIYLATGTAQNIHEENGRPPLEFEKVGSITSSGKNQCHAKACLRPLPPCTVYSNTQTQEVTQNKAISLTIADCSPQELFLWPLSAMSPQRTCPFLQSPAESCEKQVSLLIIYLCPVI